MDNIFDNLLTKSKEDIYEICDRLKKNNSDWAIMEPFLIKSAENDCNFIKIKYDFYLKAGFNEDQAMKLIVERK